MRVLKWTVVGGGSGPATRKDQGNPGPGGSGAVLVRTGSHIAATSTVLAGSISYAHPATTNNFAEYRGLIFGLHTAEVIGLHDIFVVGGSNLILEQLRTHRVPKSPHLRPLYTQARYLADKLGVREWTHHYRRHNKTADHLASQAMDMRTSAQDKTPTTNPQLQGVDGWLQSDIEFWIETMATP